MIQRSGMYLTEALPHSNRLKLGCQKCKYCYIQLGSKKKHQWQDRPYMHCMHDEVHVAVDKRCDGLTCSEFEQRSTEGIWR